MMDSDNLDEYDPHCEHFPLPGRVINLRKDKYGTAGQPRRSHEIDWGNSPLAKGSKILKTRYKTCTRPERRKKTGMDARDYGFVYQIMTSELETFLEDERWCDNDPFVCTTDDPSFEILSAYENYSQLNDEWFRMKVAYGRRSLLIEKADQQYLDLKQQFETWEKNRSGMQKGDRANHKSKGRVSRDYKVSAQRDVTPDNEVRPRGEIKIRTCWEPVQMKQETKVPNVKRIGKFFKRVQTFFSQLTNKKLRHKTVENTSYKALTCFVTDT